MKQSILRSYSTLLVILLLIAAIAIYCLWGPAVRAEGLEREIVKSLFQLSLITIIGGTAAAWSKHLWEEEVRQRDAVREEQARERDRLREAAAQRTAIYRDYMARVGAAYRSAKLIRRTLRAEGLWPAGGGAVNTLTAPNALAYGEQMRRLNEVQLTLEDLKMEAKHHPELREKAELYKFLLEMEHYLRDITSEYEETMAKLRGGAQPALSNLKYLDEFTDSSNAKGKQTKLRFEQHFASAYGEVARLLASLLLPSVQSNE
jgi:hypothetical protein